MPAGEREAHENAFKDCNRLFSAVSEGNLAVVQDHFQHGALASSTNSNGDTVLHVAVRRSQTQTVAWLMQQKASVSAQNCMHDTPMQIAQRSGDKVTLDLLHGLAQG